MRSVQVQQLGVYAFQSVEGIQHPVDGFFFAASLQHDHSVVRAEILAGLVEAYPQLDVAAKFSQGLLQVQGVGMAVVHPQADDIIAVHNNPSLFFDSGYPGRYS